MVTPALILPQFTPDAMADVRGARRRLKRTVSRETGTYSVLGMVADALGIAKPPAAALSRLGAGCAADPGWLLGEPVMLSPDRDRVVLHRLGADRPDAEETRALIVAAHAHFPASELLIEATQHGPWYVRMAGAQARAGIAVEAVTEGGNIGVMPDTFGVDRAGVRVLNELQMLWYEHPVNRARRDAGRLQPNALWVWGGGALPSPPSRVGARLLVAQSPELIGLAQWLGLERRDPGAVRQVQAERGVVMVCEAGNDALARSWLTAFLTGRQTFCVFAAGRRWDVPSRRFWDL